MMSALHFKSGDSCRFPSCSLLYCFHLVRPWWGKWKPVMLYDRTTLVRSSSIMAWWETLESLCCRHMCVCVCYCTGAWGPDGRQEQSPLFYHYYHLFTNAITDWLTALCWLVFSFVTGCWLLRSTFWADRPDLSDGLGLTAPHTLWLTTPEPTVWTPWLKKKEEVSLVLWPCWMTHRRAVFLRWGQSSAAARIVCCFVFFCSRDKTQTTLLLYIRQSQSMNRRDVGGVRWWKQWWKQRHRDSWWKNKLRDAGRQAWRWDKDK